MEKGLKMVTIKLTKHQAKVLRRLLASDRSEFADSIVELAHWVADGKDEGDRFGRNKFKNLLKHTADAIRVIDAVIDQL